MISLKDYFSRIDSNGDGRIDRSEFKQLVRELGLNRTEEIFDAGFDAIDSNGDGSITLAEFKERV